MKTFTHSGDLGDIIYSLPAIKAAGGGKLVLFDYPGRTAHGMTEAKVNRLRPLLIEQEYIHGVEWSRDLVDSSLNGFRDHVGTQGNLADAHLATQGFDWTHRIHPWLKVEANPKYRIIFSRSSRYHNHNFPWYNVVRRYGPEAAFVGFPEEYEQFCYDFGWVRYAEDQDDFLSLAKLIAGCEWFIGNQSSPLAIAHGLKHNTIMEICPGGAQHHCVFQRTNCIIGWDSKLELPVLENIIPNFYGSNDYHMWQQVYHNTEYQVQGNFPLNSVVVDIGAHVGSFSLLAFHKKVAKIICVEPMERNIEHLKKNIKGYNYELIPKAISTSKDKLRMGQANDPNGSMLHTSDNGSLVYETVTWDEILPKLKGFSHVAVKCDSEGGEYYLLHENNDLSIVEEMWLETHDDVTINGRVYSVQDAIIALDKHKFRCKITKNGPATNLIYAYRE